MSSTSHPFIGVLTRQIETAFWLYDTNRIYSAWRVLYRALPQLKPEHKRREDYKKLLKEIRYAIRRVDQVRAFNFVDSMVKRGQLAYSIDNNFWGRFMSLLWDCNMLTAGAYQEYDPTGGKSSDKVNIEIGNRDITRII